jgi:hypothetical protein
MIQKHHHASRVFTANQKIAKSVGFWRVFARFVDTSSVMRDDVVGPFLLRFANSDWNWVLVQNVREPDLAPSEEAHALYD